MDQRINIITLGVDDVPRARAFSEQLGWEVSFTDGDIVMFQAGPMVVSLWGSAQLAGDSGVTATEGWGGFTLGYAVDSPERVDAVCAEAAEAGASVTRSPVGKPFGYSGVFADPDGHTWEVAFIKGLALREDGAVALGASA
jgi:catechol 2,3-dioxygenase-like lactoylglutathione lyase family enzyme